MSLRPTFNAPAKPAFPTHRRRAAIRNGVYSVADYVTPQLGMLLAAPFLLKHLGAAQLGIWILASAAVNSGSLLSSGFGDAALKYVSMYRGRGEIETASLVVRAMLTINLALGLLIATVLWTLAPFAAGRVAHLDPSLQHACIQSFRIGSALLAVRSVDSVFISTLRAFEHYSPAAKITMFSKVGTLVAAVTLAALGHGIVAMMTATLLISTAAMLAQAAALRTYTANILLIPSLDRKMIRMICGYGCFSWLQVIAAVTFSQADRLLIGVYLGAPAVAYYGICTQAAQPIHGIVSAAFHVLFPHLSARFEAESTTQLKSTIAAAFGTNVLLTAALTLPMIFLSRHLLALWMGAEFAQKAWLELSILAAGFGLLSLNVTAHYAMLAIGQVRLVTWYNLAAGLSMLLLMLVLLPHFGVLGAASARLLFGPVTLLLYIPLNKLLNTPAEPSRIRAVAISEGV